MIPNTLLLAAQPESTEGVQAGPLMFACSVCAANIVSDIRENMRNLTGGNLEHYEVLADRSVERALDRLAAKADDAGYDGIMNVHIVHPVIVDGTVSTTVYGNAFLMQHPEHEKGRAETGKRLPPKKDGSPVLPPNGLRHVDNLAEGPT